jgi:transcriptional regulator with XRE-family HTH domain
MRLDRGLKLKDLADALNLTPAFLSSVETGKKPVPGSLIDRLAHLWGLSVSDIECLRDDAEDSADNINVSLMPFEQRRLVAGLARSLPELKSLSEDERKKRLEQLFEELLTRINS